MEKTLKLSNYFMLICFGVFVIIISTTSFSDYDFWWHARKGETIAQTNSINNPDTFSYTFNGKPDVGSEWIADYIIFQSYNLGGLIGANLLKSLILLSTFLFILGTFKTLSDKNKLWLISAILSLILIVFAIRFRFYVRPFLFSYLFFSVFIFLLVRFSHTGKNKYLYILPFVELVWTNSSKGSVFGLIVFALFIVACVFSKKLSLRLFIVGAIIVLSFCINPDGPLEYLDIFNTLTDTNRESFVFAVGEQQALSSQVLWGYGLKYTYGFQLIFIAAIVNIVFFKGYKRFFLLFLFVIFLMPTTIMIRLISFFCLASAGLLFLQTEKLLKPLRNISDKNIVFLNLIVSALLIVLTFFSTKSNTYSFGSEIKANTFPENALAFLDEKNVDGVMFNSYSIGGFSLWKAPHRKVFIDGRAGHVYSKEFLGRYQEMLTHPKTWKSLDDEWHFSYALLEYDLKDMGKHFPFHLNDNNDWALVYWDYHSAVYLKRIGENQKVIENQEYKITRPNLNDFTYLDKYSYTQKDLVEAASQIKREIDYNTENQEPRLARAYFLLNYGNEAGKKVGLEELQQCLAMKPDLAFEHTAYANILYQEGNNEAALIEVNKALSLNPYETYAIQLKEKLE